MISAKRHLHDDADADQSKPKGQLMRLVLILPLVLAGCTAAEQAVTNATRDTAKRVVNSVITDRFPGVDPAPVTECIIDNAEPVELLTIAKAAVIAVDDQTVETILDISRRPETLKCIARQGLALLGI